MDYLLVVIVAAMWLATVIGAFSAGWITGWDKAQEHHKWSRWILGKYTNRSVRF
jgi:hypothetical protein